MTRTGRLRSRVVVLAAAVLLLLLLLAPVGGAHHAGDGAAVAPTAAGQIADHGNDWAPTLGKRLRPAAAATFLGMMPVRPVAASPPPLSGIGDRSFPLSVLRV